MREIKFRAWDKRNNRWLRDDDWYLHPIKGPCLYWNEKTVFGEDLELVQYTGLKDKNGKEIYEGDIVEYSPYLGVVEWNKKQGQWYANWKSKKTPLTDFLFDEGEVIGNIYENADLLKV